MSSVSHLLTNPYENVDVSLMIPTINYCGFCALYQSLLPGCGDPSKVEMLLKVDDTKDLDKYINLVSSGGFRYKILLYPKYNGRCSLHLFFNDLGHISSGKLVWFLNDDATVKGNWFEVFRKSRNSFPDNIYAMVIPSDNGKGTKQITPLPAITREWILSLGTTKFPNYDRWVHEMSCGIKRRVVISEKDLIVSMPQGSRVLSKEDRKTIFYPALERSIKRAKKKIKT